MEHNHGAHPHSHSHVATPPTLLAGYRLAAEANFGQRLTYRIPSSHVQSRDERLQCSYGGCKHTSDGEATGGSAPTDDRKKKLMVCGSCRAVRYCSRDCQAADWKAGHRALCTSLKAKAADERPGAGRSVERVESRDECSAVVQTNGKHAEEEAKVEDEDEEVEDDNAEGGSDSPPHLVEVLQNLQSVSVTILHQRGESAAAPEDVRVTLSDTHLWYCPSASRRHKIPLYGAKVDAAKATMQLLPDHVLIKIPLQSASNASIHNDSHLLEAQKLPSLAEVAQLYCRACGESLLHPSTEGHNAELQPSSGHEHALIKKVFSLPSTYWLELADFWTCGNCCAFRQFPTDEIKAAPSVCFVSDTFLMLHSSQVDYAVPPQGDKQLEGLVSAGSEVGWSPIACRACHTPFGVKEIPPIVQEHVSLRLFTYRIANRPFSPARTRTGSPSSEENYFRADTLERFVAKHLLASSSIHAVYRFSIKAFESDKPVIFIILMNWRSSLASNLPLLQDVGRGLAPIAKLRYVDCTAAGAEEDTLGLTGGSSEVRAEEVVLWQAECEELLRILQERNRTCLPPSLAHFGGMPLSFLYH